MLHPRLDHPSRRSRSHTEWVIMPITKLKSIRPPQKPQKPPQKRAKITASISPLYLYLTHVPSRHLSLSAARLKAKPQHPLPYCLQAVFCNKQRFATPIRNWNPAAPLATSPAEIKLYPSPNPPTSSIALPKNSYSIKSPSFYIPCCKFSGRLCRWRCGSYYIRRRF